MAWVPSKHGRDQSLGFEGFLNNLQDWEHSIGDRDKKVKTKALDKEKSVSSYLKIGLVGEDRISREKTSTVTNSRIYEPTTHVPSFMVEENYPDAASEKERGNEYFKQKKFKEAFDCYSRSIGLSPTAVAYANRAMASLKIKKFQEAEDDCTEALNLDDRYIKAYSRRSTARRELGKLKQSLDDSEFALRLEPQNQEIKKQHAETKSLYEKEILLKTSGALRSSIHEASISSSQETGTSATHVDHAKLPQAREIQEMKGTKVEILNNSMYQENSSCDNDVPKSNLNNQRANLKVLDTSIQNFASRAASRAMSDAAKGITPTKTAYQFEVSWRALSGDSKLQSSFLKTVPPNALPQIFKNALSAPILIGIIKCVASFFINEMDLAVQYLDNLPKVARFDMIMMCLSNADKADILKIWAEVFCSKAKATRQDEILDKIRSRYFR